MFKPCGWRLCIEVEPVEEVTKSGIVIANNEISKRATDRGKVLKIGPLCWKGDKFDGEPWCKVGDRVVFVRYAGNEQTDPETGEKHTIINDEDIMEVISEEIKND